MNKNSLAYFQKDSIKVFNVRKVDIKDNYFGYPIGIPVARVSFLAAEGSNCPQPLPFSSVTGIIVSGNIAARANSSLVEVDQNYSEDIMDKIVINTTVLLMPCVCEDVTNNNRTNVQKKLIFIYYFIHYTTFDLGSNIQGSTLLNQVYRRWKNSSSEGCLLF